MSYLVISPVNILVVRELLTRFLGYDLVLYHPTPVLCVSSSYEYLSEGPWWSVRWRVRSSPFACFTPLHDKTMSVDLYLYEAVWLICLFARQYQRTRAFGRLTMATFANCSKGQRDSASFKANTSRPPLLTSTACRKFLSFHILQAVCHLQISLVNMVTLCRDADCIL